ncbi:hypothetical protein SLS53_002808 [Cytospora paraplurivora]|uniref:Uncharacterized protein n=1 Tax=Cytospora paraplurivora TaxID=2898453 RepID=A0AAN9UCK2_9PEZI
MPVLKLNTQSSAQGTTTAPPRPAAPTNASRNSTPAQAGSSSSGSGEPAAPVPEPLSPQFRPISTTPIPPPTIPGFASGRQTFTHKDHPPQVESVPRPPPPEPIDFRDNVDVIALESAILLLQRQKKQAEEDIRQLRRIKEEAIARPSEFVSDLAAGRVGTGDRGAAGGADEDDDDSDEESDDGNGGDASGDENDNGLKPSPMAASTSSKGKAAARSGSNAGSGSSDNAAASQPPWATLPKPQDVVRMPAINWTKYAVVGESLDRLHTEQLARPTLGTPAVAGANGAYEFRGGTNPDDGKWAGVSAPYDPLKDKLKPKGARRGG